MYGQLGPMYSPQMYPGAGGAQLAPQGFLGNLVGQLTGPAGQAIGGLFGQPQGSGQIGQALGGLGHLLPFQAAPWPVPTMWGGQQPGYGGWQFVPQGFLGHLLGQFGGPAGQAIGGLFGQPQGSGQIGQALGGLGHLLPFQTAPWPIQQQALPGSMVPPYPYSPLPYSPQPWQSTPGMMPVA